MMDGTMWVLRGVSGASRWLSAGFIPGDWEPDAFVEEGTETTKWQRAGMGDW
jgi:hypothetical protein